jgi:hypothetical protein
MPGAAGLRAGLQLRRELIDGLKTIGFECTVAVDDLSAALAAAVRLGGRVVMEPVTIPTVCELAFVEDPGRERARHRNVHCRLGGSATAERVTLADARAHQAA